MSRCLHLASLLVVLAACSRNEETPPGNDTGTETSATSPTQTDTSPTTTDATVDPDTTVGEASTSTGGESCLGDNGCYDCEPTQSEQLLNHCTDSACEPFPVTAKRLPLLEPDGSLPPLP